jgi:hypothetical protein
MEGASNDKATVLTEKLMRFYTTELFQLVRDITEHRTGRLSLRLLDWLVTSYARSRARLGFLHDVHDASGRRQVARDKWPNLRYLRISWDISTICRRSSEIA